MKLNLITLLFATALLLSAQCEQNSTDPGTISTANPALYKTWMHSHEEDTAAKMVYRPEGFAFPSARGRTGFKLEKSGKGVAYEIAPTDGTLQVPLTWTLEKDMLTLNLQGGQRRKWQILTLKNVGLEVREIN